jgi:hypothetical protein
MIMKQLYLIILCRFTEFGCNMPEWLGNRRGGIENDRAVVNELSRL